MTEPIDTRLPHLDVGAGAAVKRTVTAVDGSGVSSTPVAGPAPERARAVLRPGDGARIRTLMVAASLFAALLGAGLLRSPHGFLNDDVAQKASTVEAMADAGTDRAVLPYWGASFDPTGTLHPDYWNLTPVDDGFTEVSTAGDVIVLRRLVGLGGFGTALVLPAVSTVLAAWLARRLALRLLPVGEHRRRGIADLAMAGAVLGTPLAIYGLDLWEHAPGVAAGLGSLVLLTGLVGGGRSWADVMRAIGAGATLGVGAALRNEVLLASAVLAGAVFLVVLGERRRRAGLVAATVETAVLGAAYTTAFGAVWLANRALERAVLGASTRVDKARSVALGSVGWGARLRTAATQLVGWSPERELLTGTAVVGALLLAFALRRRATRAAVPAAVALALVAVRAAATGRNVPGLLTAAPLSVGGLLCLVPSRCARGLEPSDGSAASRRRLGTALAWGAVVAMAASALLVKGIGVTGWWGARYLLLPGVVLAVLGVVRLSEPSAGRPTPGVVPVTAAVCSVMLTLLGVSFLGVRSNGFAQVGEALVATDLPIASDAPYLLRNVSPLMRGRAALTATNPTEFARALHELQALGATCIVTVSSDATPPPTPAGMTAAPGLPDGTPLHPGAYVAWTLRTPDQACVPQADVVAAALQ